MCQCVSTAAVCMYRIIDDKLRLIIIFVSLLPYRGSTRTILARCFFFKFPPVHYNTRIIVSYDKKNDLMHLKTSYHNQHPSIRSTKKTTTPPWEASTKNPLCPHPSTFLLCWPAIYAYDTQIDYKLCVFTQWMPRSLGAHTVGVRSYTSTFHSVISCSQYLGLDQSMLEKIL